MEELVNSLMRENARRLDRTIEDAFLHHFGFPIRDVQDKEELEHIVVQGDTIESYQYRGETFLYWDKNYDIEIENSPEGTRANLIVRFKEV